MARRCDFLEDFAGFNFNGGVGSDLSKNSVLLGSTVIEAMIKEAVQMSENFDYQYSRQNIQQVSCLLTLIYMCTYFIYMYKTAQDTSILAKNV